MGFLKRFPRLIFNSGGNSVADEGDRNDLMGIVNTARQNARQDVT